MGQSYRELIAWQKAMEFVMNVYKASRTFPHDEAYGLASQIRRAAVAIPANIAQGQSLLSGGEFFNLLGRARGALVEVETEVMLAQNLAYLNAEQTQALLAKAAELGKILNGLIGSIRQAA